jgi:RNA polymerase sigma-70 factor, ECF subfamily
MQRETAEDLAQEVLMVLHEKYGEVERLEELLPLSLQIVRFKIMSLRRKVVRRGEHAQVSVEDVPIADTGDNPGDAYERKEMTDRLRAAIAQMGERCREMFRYKLEGRTFPEIQTLMGVRSINTIYTWDSRCRQHLLELMGGSWEK